jgi:S-(hydroxymethyl)glutathione dehydrogenase/alcohol dehydrogenase
MWDKDGKQIMETIQVAPPKRGEVRIKVLASGVCHTDWSEPRNYPAGFPVILGHEGGGIVESVGPGVQGLEVGDHVIPLYIPECRDCVYCLSQGRFQSNLCGKIRTTQGKGMMPDGTSRFSIVKDGKKHDILHFMGTSTFSEYTVCAAISLAKIPKEAPLETVCLLGCGITTGYGAVMNTMKVPCGATAAVFGLGGVGLAVIMGLKEVGCSKIIGVDINPNKVELAESFGMTHFVNPKDLAEGQDTVGAICALIGDYAGAGPDFSFECIGNTITMRQAFECVHKGWGQSCVIGVGPPGKEISTRPFQVVIGKQWRGTAFGGTRGRTQLPRYVQKYLDGTLKVDEFVTFTMPIDELDEAFNLMHAGKALRSVVIHKHEGDEEVAAHRALHADTTTV